MSTSQIRTFTMSAIVDKYAGLAGSCEWRNSTRKTRDAPVNARTHPPFWPPCGTRLGRQRLAGLAGLSTARLLCLAAPTHGGPRRRHLQRIFSIVASAVRRC
jgi:hypothetical protein